MHGFLTFKLTNPMSTSHERKALLAGSAWALLLRILTAISALVINVLIARIMEPTELGVYFLVVSMVTMLSLIGSFGLHMAVVRLVAEALGKGLTGRARGAVVKILILGAVSGFIVSLVIYGGGVSLLNGWFYHSKLLGESAFFVACWVFFWAMQMNIAEIFRGFSDIRLAVTFRRLAPNIAFIVILSAFYILRHKIGFHTALWAGLGAWIASTCVSSVIVFRRILPLAHDKGTVSWGEIINLSWPLGVTLFFSFGLMQADVWIIGALGQFDNVAVYGAASRLVNFVILPALVVNATMPPFISRLYAQGNLEELELILRGSATVTTLLGVVLLAGTLIFGKLLMVLVYGEFYGSGVLVLNILMIGLLFRFVGGVSELTLMMTGQEKTTMRISFMAAAVMVVMAIVLGQIYGTVGVASSVAVSSIFQNLSYLYFVRRKIGVISGPKLDYMAIKELVRLGRKS